MSLEIVRVILNNDLLRAVKETLLVVVLPRQLRESEVHVLTLRGVQKDFTCKVVDFLDEG